MSIICKACKQKVLPMDPQINLDRIILHKSCAKCVNCSCQIDVINFAKIDATSEDLILYCKAHYDSKTSLAPSLQSLSDKAKLSPRTITNNNTNNITEKFKSLGVSENICNYCHTSVYKVEELMAFKKSWHKKCFHCGGTG